MNFILMPSLEHMTVVKTAITLWNQDDIVSLIANIDWSPKFFSGKRGKWLNVEKKVIENLQQISLPALLKEKVSRVVKPVGLEILKWRECHNDQNYYSGIDVTKALCWTPQGTVNKKETAKALINHESLDIRSRYRLACIYCLENDIYKLWHEIPENERNYAYCVGVRRKRVWQEDLIALWTGYLNVAEQRILFGSYNSRNSPDQLAFHYAAISGNISAVEYFLQKLTPEEKEVSLEKFTEYVAKENLRFSSHCCTEDSADVLCFLLTQMSEEQLLEAFGRCAYKVLACLLDWPYQSFFMGTANRMWDLISGKEYFFVLYRMAIKRAAGHKDCDYQKLLWEFWKPSPNALKRYVTKGDCRSVPLISKLLEIEDKESVKLILSDATRKEKENIFFSCLGTEPCANLICSGQWDLIEFFVQECVSSQNVMIKFKKDFIDLIRRDHSGVKLWKKRNIRNKFYEFLDTLIHISGVKRSTEEGGNSSVKKSRHTEFK